MASHHRFLSPVVAQWLPRREVHVRHSSGDSGHGRRHADRWRITSRVERLVAREWARRRDDNDADVCASTFVERLEDALLAHEAADPGFDRATRKADHADELRRVLGVLLDVLADWEMLLDRQG